MKFGKTHSTLQQLILSSDPALEAVRHFQWVDVIYQMHQMIWLRILVTQNSEQSAAALI